MARGSMRQRGPESWQLRVYAGFDGGRRRFVTRTVHGTRREAEAALSALQVEVNTGKAAPTAPGTVGALLDEWAAAFAGDWSPSTRLFVDGAITRVLRPELGDRRLSRLDTAEIDRLYGKLRRRPGRKGATVSPDYIRRVHGILHAALEQAVAWNRIPTNPASKARPPRVVRAELRPPTPAEIRRILAAVDGEFGTCLRVLAATGGRRGEAAGLQWADLDMESGELAVRRRIVLGPDGPEVVALTKNRKTRKVALDPGTITSLRAHHLAMKERAMACGTKLVKDAFIFSDDPAGRTPWRPDVITRRFGKLRDDLGLADVRLNDLRHAAATQLLVAGVDVRTAAERLGHDPKTMLGIYAHPVREADQRAAQLIGGLLDDEAG